MGVFLPSGNATRQATAERIPPHTRIFADHPQPTVVSEGQGGTDSSDADVEGAHADGQPEGGTSGDATTDDTSERAHAPARQPTDRSAGEKPGVQAVLCINQPKVYNKKGKVKPQPYIFKRIKALNGEAVDAAGPII